MNEPIIGYRGWLFIDDKLRAIHNNCIWEPGKTIIAKNFRACLGSENPLNNPGIYAFKESCLFEEEYDEVDYYSGVPLIRGEVYLWGKIIEHQLGYRGEYAYPKKLYVSTAIKNYKYIIQLVRNLYGCEVESIDFSNRNVPGIAFTINNINYFMILKMQQRWVVRDSTSFIENSIICHIHLSNPRKFLDSYILSNEERENPVRAGIKRFERDYLYVAY